MSHYRRRPWSLMNQLQNELNTIFDGVPGYEAENGEVSDWAPAVDIREEAERFVLHADVPGVDPKDIEITMENGTLTISGQRHDSKEEQKEGYRRVERVSGQFFRRFVLPDSADAESISAQSKNGVLEVVIPKQAKVQPRRIEVKG
ncbi:Hsp20/alpha crystallin family protein [Natronospira bacteriovora]|uniref:Hsp20/alpha crystallin family protein n=1 Tax=Natronospira bacteriovora TaxID=3069753 RepID=UPI0035B512F5